MLGTLRGNFKHDDFWACLNFLHQQQLKFVLTSCLVHNGGYIQNWNEQCKFGSSSNTIEPTYSFANFYPYSSYVL